MSVLVKYRSGKEQKFFVDRDILVCNFFQLCVIPNDPVKALEFPE